MAINNLDEAGKFLRDITENLGNRHWEMASSLLEQFGLDPHSALLCTYEEQDHLTFEDFHDTVKNNWDSLKIDEARIAAMLAIHMAEWDEWEEGEF